MKLTLPEGWTWEYLYHRTDLLLLKRATPMAGYVTVDFKSRGFRGGIQSHGPFVHTGKQYTGRKWRDRLVADAVEYLQKAWEH